MRTPFENITLIFGIVFLLFVMQSLGGIFQIKNYQKSVKRLHKFGNVGIGQKRGGFLQGYLVLIACDSYGVITAAEAMEGMTLLAKFKPKAQILGIPFVGTHIDVFMDEFRKMDKKKAKKYKGYIQAIDALELRLYPERRDPEEMKVLKTKPNLK